MSGVEMRAWVVLGVCATRWKTAPQAPGLARARVPGYHVGGKSGTAQVRRISMQERLTGRRRQEDLPWEYRHHALFVAYAPIDQPRYACAVVVEHGIGGSATAAPICKEVLTEAQRRLRQRPVTPQRVAER